MKYKIIKLAVIAALILLLSYQFNQSKGLDALLEMWTNSYINWHIGWLVLCILLMPLNWLLETKKWQTVMSPHDNIRFLQALRTILAGVALGIVTPARIGEYGGRMLTYDPDKKTQVFSGTLLSSIAQNLCNLLVGIAFSYLFLKSTMGVTYLHSFTFTIAVVFQMLFLIFIYYNLPEVAHWVEKKSGSSFIKKFSVGLKSLDLYHVSVLNKVFLISMIRYTVYLCQYILMMKFCGVENNVIQLSANIAVIYLIQTGIPLPAFLSVFARGELAVMVWSTCGINDATALTATFGLWIINLIIPTAMGLIILSGLDLKKYLKTK